MDNWKVVPQKLNHLNGMLSVQKVEALPPGQHDFSPIVNDVTCVVCHLTTKKKRYYGTKEAKIGPDLRMHMIINPKDEVLAKWENSEFFGERASRFYDLHPFILGYIEAALWSTTDDRHHEDPDNYHECLEQNCDREDLSNDCLQRMVADCQKFQKDNEKLLEQYYEHRAYDYAGHDFWLTRNRHGVGFWDRGLGELGDKLTEACYEFGQADLYIGDDNKIEHY
jgi:hypothetical protein